MLNLVKTLMARSLMSEDIYTRLNTINNWPTDPITHLPWRWDYNCHQGQTTSVTQHNTEDMTQVVKHFSLQPSTYNIIIIIIIWRPFRPCSCSSHTSRDDSCTIILFHQIKDHDSDSTPESKLEDFSGSLKKQGHTQLHYYYKLVSTSI